jgi:hypothetical protein
MTLLVDTITEVSTPSVNPLPQYTVKDVLKPYYGAATPQPEKSWFRGEVALVDPITGWEYCPVSISGR